MSKTTSLNPRDGFMEEVSCSSLTDEDDVT